MSDNRYGWKRQPKDERDYKVAAPIAYNYPTKYEIVSKAPIFNQGSLGSCTANSAVRVYQHLTKFAGSRLFLYYVERLADGSINEDAGSTIRQSVKQLANTGVCAEALCPYIIDNFAIAPGPAAYTDANRHKVLRYEAVRQTEKDLCQAIANGNMVLFGFDVYDSFESETTAKTGRVMLPKFGEQLIGGHAVHIVGYDTTKKLFKCANSWGTSWGDKGFFYIPFRYVLSTMADDFWIIKA